MINILTIDLEDYFMVSAFEAIVKSGDWHKYESRIERNTYRLLEILEESGKSHNAERIASKKSLDLEILPQASDLQLQSPQGSTQTSYLLPNAHCSPSPCASRLTPVPSNLQPPALPKATFFCVGWVAQHYPHLIREINRFGHEIACHGYAHKLIYNQSRGEFREDIRKAKSILEDIIGEGVIGYRAPSYSITKKSLWAFDILAEEGYRYDSSIFPIRHDVYGYPNAPRFPFVISMNGNNTVEFKILKFATPIPNSCGTVALSYLGTQSPHSLINSTNPIISINSNSTSSPDPNALTPNSKLRPQNPTPCPLGLAPNRSLIEFPMSTIRMVGMNLPISGGGYFRLFPYSLIKKALEKINKKEGHPFIFYLHPWEIDPGQPRMHSIYRKTRFRHYINLNKTENRFKKLLKGFNFSSIKEIIKLIKVECLNKREIPFGYFFML